MSTDDATRGGNSHDAAHDTDTVVSTPVFDATVRALAAPDTAPAGSSAVEHTQAEGAAVRGRDPGARGDAGDGDWVDQGRCDSSAPAPVLDPDTPEGMAILRLHRQLTDSADADGRWHGTDTVGTLCAWFAELGIDEHDRPADVLRRLRQATRQHRGGETASAVYGVRIGTEHHDPELIIRTALHVLVRQLGPGTSIDLVSHDRDVLARIEHHPTSDN
jgi:hypothetical protein